MDSFKGCLGAADACAAAARGVCSIHGNTAHCLPLADGGEGTAEAICAAMGGRIVPSEVIGPDGNTYDGYYGVIPDKGLAVIDTAAASGLALAKRGKASLPDRSTAGTGLQIAELLDLGYRSIIVGLGGSGTNDGGLGAISALGAKVYANDGTQIEHPCARDLKRIAKIDVADAVRRLDGCELTLMYDVDIPLTGERGASLNYSRQKGAERDMSRALEAGMKNYADAARRSLGVSVGEMKGAGAAGGLGFGLALIGGKLIAGAENILTITDFAERCCDADVVITGEGRTDFQTADGKLPVACAAAAKKHGLPVVCVCGSASPVDALYEAGIDAIFSVQNGPMSIADSIASAAQLIENTCKNLAGFADAFINKHERNHQ